MTRQQLEHIIRASGAITNLDTIVVVGSQAILGAVPSAPADLLKSMEADVYPLDKPDYSDLIDGAIGEGSQFHETFEYYAHGVGPETAVLPLGWETRATGICNANTNSITGICPSPLDFSRPGRRGRDLPQ